MKTLFRLAVVALIFVAARPVAAQSTGDGSIYSAFGLGELVRYGSSQVQAMGGGGTAIHSLNYSNFSNPAALSDQVLARIAGGVQFETVSFTDGDASSRLNQGALDAVQLSFPLIERRLGLGFSLSPYSRVNYRVRETGQITAPDTVFYGVDSEGRGGLHALEASVGFGIIPEISIGASVGYLFGILEEGRRTFFIGGDHRPTELMNGTRLGGLKATLGTQIVVPGPFTARDILYAGATFSIPTTLSGDRVRTVGSSLDRDTLGTAVDASVDLPWAIDAGVAYRLDSRWLFVVDGSYAPWSQFSSTVPFGGYDAGSLNTFQDRMRVSAGMEVLPAGNDALASFFGRTAYRLGAYMEQSYVNPAPDFDLITYALTGGVSLPAIFSGTRIDLNVEVGTRGTTDQGLVRDLFYRFSASVNIGERWFEQRKLR